MCKKSKDAFTLAEVLITLTIIGVIADLTLPSVFADANEAEINASFKKTYSAIDQATRLIMLDNGGVMQGSFSDTDSFGELYALKLNAIKYCDTAHKLECFGFKDTGAWYTKSKETLRTGLPYSSMVLNSSSNIIFRFWSKDCKFYSGSGAIFEPGNSCGYIKIDANGFKGPNREGRDIHTIEITNTGAVPHSDDNYHGSAGGGDKNIYGCFYDGPDAGQTCATRILIGEDWGFKNRFHD